MLMRIRGVGGRRPAGLLPQFMLALSVLFLGTSANTAPWGAPVASPSAGAHPHLVSPPPPHPPPPPSDRVRGFAELRLRGGGEEGGEYDSKDAEKYDQALWEMMTQHPDEIHFLNTVFNFLQRRTPCFNGPKALTNYKILIETLSHQRDVYEKHISKGKTVPPPDPMPAKQAKPPARPVTKPSAAPAPPPVQAAAPAAAVPGGKAGGKKDDGMVKDSASEEEQEEAGGAGEGVMDVRTPLDKEREREMKKKAALGQDPVNNGGTTDRYVWTQTLNDLNVDIFLPKGTRARDLEVLVRKKSIKVSVKATGKVVLEGELEEEVLTDETVWTVEDDVLTVTLHKSGDQNWWKCVVKGDPYIDLKKVEPENSQLGDLEPDMRQTVEKMMFDQRQKAMGLPTLDESKNKDLLNKFMSQHPEMDFSKCKFN